MTEYVRLINFQDPIYKINLNIYYAATVFSFPQKLAESQ